MKHRLKGKKTKIGKISQTENHAGRDHARWISGWLGVALIAAILMGGLALLLAARPRPQVDRAWGAPAAVFREPGRESRYTLTIVYQIDGDSPSEPPLPEGVRVVTLP